MSDEEVEYSEEEYEEEAEEQETGHQEEEYKYDYNEEDHGAQKSRPRANIEIDDKNMSEGEKAMMMAKKRQEEEDKMKLLDYEERRRMEREKEEEELRLLKEKQEQRRLQREKEEQEQAEKQRQIEEKRKQEEEARRARMEAERKRKEEEKLKKAQAMGAFIQQPTDQPGGRNFVIEKKADKGDRFGNIVQAKQEMGMTKEQQEEAKKRFLHMIKETLDLANVPSNELKAKIKEMHQRICKLEADKYDLEKRNERQTYDLKELNERQRQMFRNKISKQGADATDDSGGRHPPKIRIMSKYDRQIDRRSYRERRAVYENDRAFPVFPNVPPPPIIMEFKIAPEPVKKDELDDMYGYSYNDYGEDAEE